MEEISYVDGLVYKLSISLMVNYNNKFFWVDMALDVISE